jgi:hypothetical protein
MNMQQLIWITCGYLVAFVVVVYFTRATARRVLGALAGGLVATILFLGMNVLGVKIGWWQSTLPSTPGLLGLFYLSTAISLSPMYLVTWRVARRFGWSGLAVCFVAAAVIGPPRDYLIAAAYPDWIVFAPGLAPVVAVSVTYVGIVALGHAIMRLVAGSAAGDQLARLPQGVNNPEVHREIKEQEKQA